MEYYLAIKKYILPFVTAWMDLENTIVLKTIIYYFMIAQ